MYKLGLKLWSINTDYYYEEAVKLYNKGIFDYIELYAVPNTVNTIEKWQKIGIPFIIHCPHFMHGFNLAQAEKRESNFAIYQEVKQFADKLNAKYIIFHGGVDGDIKETAKQLATFKEPRALLENKPMLAIPNRMGGNFCRGYNAEEITTVQKAASCGFCLDFGHAICAANSLKKEVYTYCRDLLALGPKMFHLTDNTDINSPYDTHPHLGQGQLDLEKIKQMLPQDAIITLETDKDSKNNIDDFISDCNVMRKLK